MDAAILPVKSPARAKSRLAERFPDAVREEIAWALLEDALALCLSAPFVRWWVVSDDPGVLRLAHERGLDGLRDPGTGLNDALAVAVAAARDAAADSVTVIPSDVPLAYHGDILDLIDTGATSDLVVVPSRTDGGTNALYMAPPEIIPPQFGPGSLRAHVELAERRGLRCAILALPRLELDIDTPEDVDAFMSARRPAPTRTAEVLERALR
jgi:2-phospho-L-lactate/phosphoenolpyruvate guanylyltransferase